ncbi:MAG: right-handed parallel beta-helix repeat-containing protein [Sedimentisphaeraceae bacterium JB056]
MKYIAILLVLVLSGFSAGSTVYFDLDDSYIVSGNWNTVSDWTEGVHVIDAIDSDGNQTAVSLNCADGFAMYNSSGESAVTAYPTEAGMDSFYLSYSNSYAKIQIGGLTEGQSYDFTFFGSRASSGPRALDISIGGTQVTLDAAYNISDTVTINGVVAPSSGIVQISVSLSSGSSYGYLGVIEINGNFAAPQIQPEGIFVAPWGLDSNPGTYNWPKATMSGAFDAVADYKQTNGLPVGGLDVNFRGGHYYFTSTAFADSSIDGEAGKPVTFKPYNDEEVIFDGSVEINSSDFSLVTDQSVLGRLGDNAAGNVYGCYISESSLRDQLSNVNSVVDLDGKMAQVSRYPNVGNSHIDSVIDAGEIYAVGRTPGDPPTYSMSDPIGAEFTIQETDAAEWELEYQSVQKAVLTGYLANDWYKESHTIASINSGAVKLLEYSRYEINSSGARRFYVLNLMCELDSEGEWYFDESANILYVWPYEPITSQTDIGVWNGPEFLKIYCSYVNFEDFIIQGTTQGASGSGMITFYAGDNVKFTGCTFRNTSRPAVSFMSDCTTTNSGVVGCDFYDASSHLNIYGGVADENEITAAGNYAINCHFTQVQARDYLGRVYFRGVGNIFRNNLIHNLPDDPVKAGGYDNVFELNEIFNCGFESGDGGAIYWSAGMESYGNIFRNNFLHHLMCTPGLHPKGGMYPDQLDAGDTFQQNVFYKAAHRAILLNGGAGHRVEANVFLQGCIGLYQTESYAQGAYDDIPLYDNGTLTRGDVGDYIWRTEQVVGVEGWNSEPWLSHFPLFATVMNQEMMRFWPIENYFNDNMFYGNTDSNLQYRFTSSSVTTDFASLPSYVSASDNRNITLDVFVDPSKLNFKFVDNAPLWAPAIPFDNIGLYVGDGRTSVPNKNTYRSLIKENFAARPSYDESASYNPATINSLVYYNTGELLMNLPDADFNSDGIVNMLDYSVLGSEWQRSDEEFQWNVFDFDTFTLGELTAQQGWEAKSTIDVVATSDDGLYTAGRALKDSNYGDDWPRADQNGIDLGIDTSQCDMIKISFDVREGTNPSEGTTLYSARLFLRNGATSNYSPSFGISAGKVALRPEGEQGDTIEGNNLAGSAYYGADKYWEKGDWLRITLILDGETYRNATLEIKNLSKGGTDIPTGIANIDVGRDIGSDASLWNRPTFRLSGSYNTYVDNIITAGEIKFVPVADVTLDGSVDIDDLAELAAQWL